MFVCVLSILMLDDKQGVAGTVNSTIGLNINQDNIKTAAANWEGLKLGPGTIISQTPGKQ